MAPQTGFIDPITGAILGPTGQPVSNPVVPMSEPSASAAYTPSTAPANSGFAQPTGWAGQQGYTPEMLESIYQNPWFLLQDVFKGIKTSSPG